MPNELDNWFERLRQLQKLNRAIEKDVPKAYVEQQWRDLDKLAADLDKSDKLQISYILQGDLVFIETVSEMYRIQRDKDGFLLDGHKQYCPKPTRVRLNGSTWGGSAIRAGMLVVGLRMEYGFPQNSNPFTTGEIMKITVYRNGEEVNRSA